MYENQVYVKEPMNADDQYVNDGAIGLLKNTYRAENRPGIITWMARCATCDRVSNTLPNMTVKENCGRPPLWMIYWWWF